MTVLHHLQFVDSDNAYLATLHLPAVPRIGDAVHLIDRDVCGIVTHVMWRLLSCPTGNALAHIEQIDIVLKLREDAP